MHRRYSIGKTGKRRFRFAAAIALLALSAHTGAGEHRGAPAHYRAACVECHAQMVGGNGGLLYTRPDRLARSRAELRDRIAYCQRQLELRWSGEQIRETADYLNERFYHYPD
ncbi:MAG: cytochrome c [Gammaproteobacteria bacterium]|nr:cytochrome c [Gammaproteobacteria bacterium]